MDLKASPQSVSKTNSKRALSKIERESSGKRRLAAEFLKAPAFDHGMGILILFNMVLIIVETDHSANSDDSVVWVDAIGNMILMIFIFEMSLRLYVFGKEFFSDKWNSFDFVIVASDVIFTSIGLVLGSVFPVSLLRIFRLFKLVRVSKIVRVFPELRLMVAGLVGSVRAIFWGGVLLGFVLLIWSIIAVQLIYPLSKELSDGGYYEDCKRCSRAYASVWDSVLTFSQQIVAGDSWGQATIPVIENYPYTAFFFMMVFMSVGIAVLNLILGVVVNVAQQEHERHKTELEDEKRLERMDAHHHLLQICEEMDADGSGEISQEELLKGYREREDLRYAFNDLDLQEEDVAVVWTIMDVDRSGSVSYNEFVTQIYKMKATDNQFMLAYIKYHISKIKDTIVEHMRVQEAELAVIEKDLEGVAPTVEAPFAKVFEAPASLETPAVSVPQKSKELVEENHLLEEIRVLRSKIDKEDINVDLPAGIDERTTKLSQRIDANITFAREQTVSTTMGDAHVSGVFQRCDAIMDISRQNQRQLIECMQHMRSSLEKQLSTALSSIPQASASATSETFQASGQKPKEDLLTVPRNVPHGLWSLPACCRQNPSLITVPLGDLVQPPQPRLGKPPLV